MLTFLHRMAQLQRSSPGRSANGNIGSLIGARASAPRATRAAATERAASAAPYETLCDPEGRIIRFRRDNPRD